MLILVLDKADVLPYGSGNEAYNPEEPSIDVTEPSKVPVWMGHQPAVSEAPKTDLYNIATSFPPTSITGEQNKIEF